MNESDSIDQVLLKKVQEAIEKNYSDSSYGVREYRLEKAFEFLQMRVGTISYIAYQVGLNRGDTIIII